MTTRSLGSRSAPLAFVALAATSLVACPGRITDTSPFLGSTGEGGVMGCSIPSSQIEQQLIRPRCATQGCHDRGDRAANLDLQSPGVAARLLGQMSNCNGQPLINDGNRAVSYFIEKVASSTPACGRQMPLGQPAFSQAEVACVRTWVMLLDPNMSMPDAGMDVPNPPNDVPTPMDVPSDRPTPPDTSGMDASDAPSPPMDVTPADAPNPPMDVPTPTDTGVPADSTVDEE
jgi:hypothetical protein